MTTTRKPTTRHATRKRPTTRRSRAAASLEAVLDRLETLNLALHAVAKRGPR